MDLDPLPSLAVTLPMAFHSPSSSSILIKYLTAEILTLGLAKTSQIKIAETPHENLVLVWWPKEKSARQMLEYGRASFSVFSYPTPEVARPPCVVFSWWRLQDSFGEIRFRWYYSVRWRVVLQWHGSGGFAWW